MADRVKPQPEWKNKLTDTLRSLGLLKVDIGRIEIHIHNGKVCNAVIQEIVK